MTRDELEALASAIIRQATAFSHDSPEVTLAVFHALGQVADVLRARAQEMRDG